LMAAFSYLVSGFSHEAGATEASHYLCLKTGTLTVCSCVKVVETQFLICYDAFTDFSAKWKVVVCYGFLEPVHWFCWFC
jgi:hypothetical protein